MKQLSSFLATVLLVTSLYSQPSRQSVDPVATYSIVAWDSSTGDLGIAVQSKFLAVGAVVPYAKAGVGAIATQSYANTEYGPRGLEMLASGMTAQLTADALLAADPGASSRQVGIVDARGNSYSYTGTACLPYAGGIMGHGYAVQGNILTGQEVVLAMARTFEMSRGSLAERMLASLEAGEKAGGDKRGRQSAALLVVREKGGYGGYNDRFIDLRVDDDSLSLVELRRLFNLWSQTFLLEARFRSIEAFKEQKNFVAADHEMKSIVNEMNALLRDRPDDPEVLNRIAWSMATHDVDLERALELAKRASALSPASSNIRDTMAECYYRLGRYDDAIAIESELVAKEPGNDGYWKQLQKFKEAKQKSGR